MVRICDASCIMIRAPCVWKNVSNFRIQKIYWLLRNYTFWRITHPSLVLLIDIKHIGYCWGFWVTSKTKLSTFLRWCLKLGPHDAWFVFAMRYALWFAHHMYEKMCLIWVNVLFVHLSHLVRQLAGKLTHQSKLYVSDSTNLFDTFTHDAPRIRITHRMDPAYHRG